MKYRVLEIFDWYDGPLSYTFTFDEYADTIFYSHLYDSDDSGYLYVEIKISEKRLELAKKGKLDIFTILTQPEDGMIYTYDEKSSKLVGKDVKAFLSENEEGWLPRPGLNLSCPMNIS